MNRKKLIAGVLSLMLAGSLFAGCGSKDTGSAEKKAEGAKYTFRLAETHPADYPTTLGDKKFAELVNERTKGRIKIEVFPSSQLGEEKAVIEQVQLGAIEFTRVSSSPLAEFNKAFGVFSLPYIFDNDAHMWKFLSGEAGNKMLDGLEKSKMKGLAYYSSGSRSFYTKKPVTKVEDLKGLKIRVQQNKINMDLISSLGASATPMPYGEVFSGLQTGVIDGAENNSPSYLTANHYQAVKNYILDGHQRVPEVLLISKVTWDKLSEEDRKIIKQAAIDSVTTQRELWGKFEKESMDKLKANGVVVTEVTDVKPWQAAVKPVIDKHGENYKEELAAIEQARK
ncbi:TRAP transporter substrate-binding protein [Sporomusa malonica]|uniref:Tripartite ATP-independent transporter solute receptor, DctP family n=1 Tax=Sporomusa malonica TaxID=112901 RepID=A0A1W2CNR0_9FIRM|nr:TRAP transporter substrate-binding protein [Sporomusa malonica]SMC86877.1 tripartite ATP-independent transporter solute receptor, DctP family [Sporomusa malonica]